MVDLLEEVQYWEDKYEIAKGHLLVRKPCEMERLVGCKPLQDELQGSGQADYR